MAFSTYMRSSLLFLLLETWFKSDRDKDTVFKPSGMQPYVYLCQNLTDSCKVLTLLQEFEHFLHGFWLT
jgi:hypothetical protein